MANKKVLIGIFITSAVIILIGGLMVGLDARKQDNLRKQSKQAPLLTKLGHAGIIILLSGFVGVCVTIALLARPNKQVKPSYPIALLRPENPPTEYPIQIPGVTDSLTNSQAELLAREFKPMQRRKRQKRFNLDT